MLRRLMFGVTIWLVATITYGDDWPQWLGPERDAVWRETGVVSQIPPDGLRVKWRISVQHGYSGPAVAKGRVYLMDYAPTSGKVVNNPGGAAKLEGKERVLCFDANTGAELWKHEYEQPYNISYPGGPRSTPTVVDGKVYTLGAEGHLSCLRADTGKLVWEKSLTEVYATQTPIWGYASHPFVVGNLLYILAGGDGTVCVALNKDTGEQVWAALSAPEPGYGTPALISHAGKEQLLVWIPETLNSLNPATGEVFWSVPLKPGFGMSIMAPRKIGNHVYCSAIGDVSALVRLDDQQPAAEIAWQGTPKSSIYCSNGTPFLDGDMIYGCDIETGALMGARLQDGERLWQTTQPMTTQPTSGSERRSRHATAFIVKNADRYFLFGEQGDLIIAQLSPEGYHEVGRFHVLEPTNEAFGRKVVWSHPAFAQRSLFARNDEELVCVDLAE
ncbi:MAG: PQQ-like beta-propeller repeat protein [Planctomycetales bacterium]|nr:PQQ-like beta-propeller repeat protein [Planctomycetales bacterium]